MSVGQVAREVVGAKDRHHAVRFVAQQRFTVRQRRLMKARPLVIGLDGDSRPCRSSPALRCGSPTAACWSRGKSGSPAPLYASPAARQNAVRRQYARPAAGATWIKRRARRGAGRLDVVSPRAGRLPQQRLILRGQSAHRCAAAAQPLPGYKLCFYRHDLLSSGFRVTVKRGRFH